MTTTPTPRLSNEWLGSVSHGTMREEDLIPAFLEVLDAVDPELAADLGSAWEAMLDEDGRNIDDGKEEEASELCHHLFDLLDAIAPEGSSFGAHEGDGADYGFWLFDEGDDNENYFDAEDEPENPYAGPGGLLDEVRQSERLLGTE